MSFGTTQVLALTDSIAQAVADFTTNFTTGTASAATTINTGVTTSMIARVLAYSDLPSELVLIAPSNKVAGNVAADLTGRRSLTQFYTQFYPLMDALDTFLGGLNAYLVTNTLQVSANFANAFNAYAASAVALQFRTSANAPTAIATANFFPSAAIDNMWTFTASGATTFSANTVGANASTAVSGGGVAPFYIYKSNSGAAAANSVFTITYVNAAGANIIDTFTCVAATSPTGSGSLAAGFAINVPSAAVGSAIVSVTGTAMTSGEIYVIGQKLVRASGY